MTDSNRDANETLKEVGRSFSDYDREEMKQKADEFAEAYHAGDAADAEGAEQWAKDNGFDDFVDFKNHLQSFDLVEYLQEQR